MILERALYTNFFIIVNDSSQSHLIIWTDISCNKSSGSADLYKSPSISNTMVNQWMPSALLIHATIFFSRSFFKCFNVHRTNLYFFDRCFRLVTCIILRISFLTIVAQCFRDAYMQKPHSKENNMDIEDTSMA